MTTKHAAVNVVSDRVQISVNINTGGVDIEVGFKPNEFARFLPDQLTIEDAPGPVNLTERGEHKISLAAVSTFFTFSVPIFAQPGTPFTIKLSTSGECNGWFKFGGLQCGADHGGTVEQTFNASLTEGFTANGEPLRS